MRRVIETASLLILVSVVTLRPLIEESYDPSGSPFTKALEAVSDPSPLRTLAFDLLILLGALGWGIARAIGPARKYRFTGLELGGALICLAAAVSCFAAGNKRLAINAAIDWLCLPILAIALVQLMKRAWHRRLLLAAILATACVQAAECVEQRRVGFEDTWEHYQSIREDFWARQGVDLDSPRVDAFERRLRAREATGFLHYSNVAGSYLVLCAFAAIGVTIAAWSGDRPAPRHLASAGNGTLAFRRLTGIGAVLGCGLITVGAVLTKSTGALTAGAIGLVLWLIGFVYRRWIDTHRTIPACTIMHGGSEPGAQATGPDPPQSPLRKGGRRAPRLRLGFGWLSRDPARSYRTLLIGWACVAASALGVLGYGLKYDRLPGWSLTFRWQYWRASSELIADHLFTGVGRENFGRHYLRYKSIQSAEEVANPHNLFVQAAADWGMLGLVGIVTMMVGASPAFTKRAKLRPPPSALTADSQHTGAFIASAALLALVVTLGRMPLLGTSDPNRLYYATVTTGIYWILGFVCFAVARFPRGDLDQATAGLIRVAAAIGLLTFLLHDMINFAMFVPATATTFFAVLAFCLAKQMDDDQGTRKHSAIGRWLPVVAVVAALVAITSVGIVPVARGASSLRLARQAGEELAPVPLTAHVADHHFRRAAQFDPFDPTPWIERAEWAMSASAAPEHRDEAFQVAAESLELAVRRDPLNNKLRRMLAQVHQARAKATGDPAGYIAAVKAAQDALELYPLDPGGIVTLADCQLEAAQATGFEELLRDAVENYRRALRLDDSRPLWAKLACLSPKQRKAVEAKMERAEQLLQENQ